LRIFKHINKTRAEESIDTARLPSHIAIIMDGNGRWATAKGLPRTAGHKEGSETFRRVATYLNNIGLKHLTVYAFSTENWSRPKEEVDAIMKLLKEYLLEACEKMVKDNISLRIVGDQSRLSPELRDIIKKTDELSLQTNGLKVNVCINYGGRAEIVNAARILAEKAANNEIKPEDIDINMFSENLYTSGTPDADLVIRPGGELRISNFLLWQSAYAEFYFTDTLWPDFDEKEIDRAILSFQKRHRRFGGI